MSHKLSLNIPILARVEGEGALELKLKNNHIESLKLKIYEPPRLFEKFLEGRSYEELLDIVARICGICPVAYQMSTAYAIEQCFNLTPDPWVRSMRRVFYSGEWIESHSLHIHLLALPDFLGFDSAAEMAKKYSEEVRRGLRLQAYGNELIKLFGKRSVHPVGACIGGFYHAPSQQQIAHLIQQGEERVEDCKALITWLATITLPDNSQDFTSVSLYHPNEYPMCEGNIVSDQGLNIAKHEFGHYFKEYQVPYSNALHCKLQGKPYLVGPLARVNNCFGHLPVDIQLLLQEMGIVFPSKNMSQSILARAIEIYYGVLESLRILKAYTIPHTSYTHFTPQAGEGFGCTEAPRGLLWHSLDLDDQYKIKHIRIVPPTSQNQARIEEDLYEALQKFGLHKPLQELRSFAEMVIRNYDPCISCSTHFLNLKVEQND